MRKTAPEPPFASVSLFDVNAERPGSERKLVQGSKKTLYKTKGTDLLQVLEIS